MSYEFFVGLRHLKARKREGFISLITVISIIGVMLGVMALIVVLSVMKGFEKDLRDKILGANAHVVILKMGGEIEGYRKVVEEVKGVPGVTAATPFIYSQVMVTSHSRVGGVVLKGVDPQSVGDVTDLPKHMVKGGLEGLKGRGDEVPGIILGKELADKLGADIDDIVNVVSPIGTSTPFGNIPLKAPFRVAGIFRFGMYEYDSNLVFIDLSDAQGFFGMEGRVTGVEVNVSDIFATSSIAKRISSALRSRFGSLFIVKDWRELNSNLFSALKLERITMFIILTLIILVAAFNIVGTLIMVVMDKSKEIAILRAMGATKRSILRIFVVEGFLIGIIGTSLGCIGGFVLDILLSRYHFIRLPQDIYYIDSLPVVIDPVIFVSVAIASLVISFIATLYPSWKASTLNVVEAIRYE